MSRLSRKCGSLDVSQLFGPPRPVTEIALLYIIISTDRRTPLVAINKQNTEYMNTDIHILNGIGTHYPSVRAGEDGSCLRLRGHRGRQRLCVIIRISDLILNGQRAESLNP
jgi:hypothetical protein